MAAIAALAAGILVLVSLNRQARDLEASESRAALAEAERDTLQRDSQRHGQLERSCCRPSRKPKPPCWPRASSSPR
jgi:type II secretory pathway component PulJ